jgi:zinc protease
VVRKRNAERVEKKLEDLYLKEFYKGHPLGRDSVAERDKMDLIEASDIREFLKKGMAKDVLFVGGSGDIDEEKMREFLDYMFEGIEEKSLISDLEDFKPNYEGELRDVDEKSSKQSFVLMVKDGIERKDKDFYPFYVADFVFGGSGLNSRLNKVMREENGLTYGIYSYLSQGKMVNTWNVAWSASPNNTKKIEELFEKEYEKFIDEGITLEELEVAKESLLSSFNLRFNSLASIAEQLYYIGQEGLGADFLKNRQQYIRDIKLADVNRVIKERWGKNNDKRWFRLNGSEAKE